MPGKPPTVANLTWIGDLKFAAAFPKHVHEATRGEGDPAERVAEAGAPGVICPVARQVLLVVALHAAGHRVHGDV